MQTTPSVNSVQGNPRSHNVNHIQNQYSTPIINVNPKNVSHIHGHGHMHNHAHAQGQINAQG